jgi:hypothetical protein
MPCPSHELRECLLNEQLASPERDAIEAHVEQCAQCQEEIERLLNEAAPPAVRRLPESAAEAAATVALVPHLHDAPHAPGPAAEAAPQALPVLPGYEVFEEVGRGGMGVVYRARHQALNRVVAVKMILAAVHADAEARRRFRAEAEAVARLQHPHIVPIYEVNEVEGLAYFALEFCAGGSLAKQLDGTPWPAMRAAQLVETLARAMNAAHQAHLVHRDLKPGNILLTAEGQPKITDFGLAKKLGEAGHTQTGAVVGTPSYMAPARVICLCGLFRMGKVAVVGGCSMAPTRLRTAASADHLPGKRASRELRYRTNLELPARTDVPAIPGRRCIRGPQVETVEDVNARERLIGPRGRIQSRSSIDQGQVLAHGIVTHTTAGNLPWTPRSLKLPAVLAGVRYKPRVLRDHFEEMGKARRPLCGRGVLDVQVNEIRHGLALWEKAVLVYRRLHLHADDVLT